MTPQEQRNKRFDEKFPYHGFRDNAENEFHSNLLKSHLTSEVNLTIEQVEKWASKNSLHDSEYPTPPYILTADLLSFLTTLKK